jgi:hypothetical protein
MKRILLVLTAAVLVGIPLFPSTSAAGIQSAVNKNGKIDANALREMLTNGLRATREDEKDFVDYVVERVVARKLPLALVYASFDYARKRHPQYPFPYFYYSVKTLAKRKNIDF